MYPLPDNRDIESVSRMHLLYLEPDSSPRLPFHSVTALRSLQILCGIAIYRDYLVSADKSGLICRGAVIRLVDDHILPFLLVYHSPDTAVGPGDHHLEIIILFLGDIDSIWVETSKHLIYPRPHYPVYRKGVHIRTVEFLQYGIMYLLPLPEPETPALGTCRRCSHGECRHGRQKHITCPFHIHNFVSPNCPSRSGRASGENRITKLRNCRTFL